MPKPEHHVFVCIQNRGEGHPRGSCGAKSASKVLQRFAEELTAKQLLGSIALTQTTCLGPCHLGPSVLVYPQGVMYSEVNESDVETIVEQHLLQGEVVTEKLAPAEVW